MGEAASVLAGVFECECCSDCAKYVLNAAHCSSKCSNCCELEVETQAIAIADDSEEELAVGNCIRWHRN